MKRKLLIWIYFGFPEFQMFKPLVFLLSIKDLKLFSLLFNLSQLMNTKNEQVAAESCSKTHFFSISGCHVMPVCPSIYLIKMTIFSQMAPAHLNILIEMTVNTHHWLDTHMHALTHAYSCTHTLLQRPQSKQLYQYSTGTDQRVSLCVCVCVQKFVCVWAGECVCIPAYGSK